VLAQQTIVLQANVVNPTCPATSDGSIALTITGGSAPYTVDGTPIAGNQFSVSNLHSGFYTFNIADANNAYATADLTLVAPQTMNYQATVFNPTSATSNDGRINITVDVTAVFNWSSISGGAIVPGQEDQLTLSGGSYSLEIVELNGCVTAKQFDLVAPTPNPIPGVFFTSSYNPLTTTIASNNSNLPSAMTIYPNPSNGHINLRSNRDTKEAVVLNDLGNVVHTLKSTENGSVLGLDLNPGTYTLQTTDIESNVTTERIVIR